MTTHRGYPTPPHPLLPRHTAPRAGRRCCKCACGMRQSVNPSPGGAAHPEPSRRVEQGSGHVMTTHRGYPTPPHPLLPRHSAPQAGQRCCKCACGMRQSVNPSPGGAAHPEPSRRVERGSGHVMTTHRGYPTPPHPLLPRHTAPRAGRRCCKCACGVRRGVNPSPGGAAHPEPSRRVKRGVAPL